MFKIIKIHRNRVQCNHCHKIVESKYTHDVQVCACHRVAVDGGLEYLNRMGRLTDFTDLSEVTYLTSDGRLEVGMIKNIQKR